MCDGKQRILRPLQLPAGPADIYIKPLMCIQTECRCAARFRGASDYGRALACTNSERDSDRGEQTRCAFY